MDEIKTNVMQTVKVFLASSKELREDRDAIANLIRSLNDYYINKGLYIKLFRFEDENENLTGRKQDEYDDFIRDCDIFIGLFWTKAGPFTIEEFDVAKQSYDVNKRPAIYIYMKDNNNEEDISLTNFKKYILSNIGHYPSCYNHTDKLKFDFLLHWVKYNPIFEFENILVRDSQISIKNGPSLFPIQNLSFARNNPEHIQLQNDILRAQENVRKYPADDDFKKHLSQLYKRKDELENDLLSTAKTISMLSSQTESSRLSQAIALFERGDNNGANALLNTKEIVHGIDNIILKLKSIEDISKDYIKSINIHIDELLLKVQSIIVAHQDSWENNVFNLYEKMVSYKEYMDFEKYLNIMLSYGFFCKTHEYSKKALDIYLSLSNESELSLEDKISTLNNLGVLYRKYREYRKSINYFEESMNVLRKLAETEHRIPIFEYFQLMDSLSSILKEINLENEAIECYDTLLQFLEECYGEKADTIFHVATYANKGNTLIKIGDEEKQEDGWKLLKKAYEMQSTIFEKTKDEEDLFIKIQAQFSLANESINLKPHFDEGYGMALSVYNKLLLLFNKDKCKYINLLANSGYLVAKYERDKENNKRAIEICEDILSLIHDAPNDYYEEHSELVIRCMYLCFQIYQEFGNESLSLKYSEMIFGTLKKCTRITDNKQIQYFGVIPIQYLIQHYEMNENQDVLNELHEYMIYIYDIADDYIKEDIQAFVFNSYVYMAFYYCNKKEFEEAISHFDKVVRILKEDKDQDEDIFTYEMRLALALDCGGVTKIKTGNIKEGKSNVFEAYELFQKNKEYIKADYIGYYANNLNNCAYALSREGLFDKAEQFIMRAMEISSDDANTLDTYGEILYRKGMISEALKIYNRILEIDVNYYKTEQTVFSELMRREGGF